MSLPGSTTTRPAAGTDSTETLAAGSWSAATAPTAGLTPRAQFVNAITQISCRAPGSCVAIGTYQDVSGIEHAMLDTRFSFHAPRYAPVSTAGKIVGIAADGPGYLLATSTGKVTSVNAPSFGSVSGAIRAPVVGIATDQATGGYWLTSSAGNVYGFNAAFLGSKKGDRLPAPVVGVAADGSGYLLVTRAGNVYNFGTPFYGSLAGKKLPVPVVGIAADPATGGYWLATSAGHVYAFHAPSYGSLTGKTLPAPVVAVAADGLGYLLITRAGHVYSFHTASYGSVTPKPPAPIAGAAVAG